jgi:hypothetical protein
MILAIEADGAGYRDSGSVRDRDRLRKEHLERLGWRVHRLWSTAWFTDPGGELAKLRSAFDSAVGAAPPPPPAPEAPAGSVIDTEPPSKREQASCGEVPGSQSRPQGLPQHGKEPGEQEPEPAAEPLPQTGTTLQTARVIPMGAGERYRLTASAPRALPASKESAPPPGNPGQAPNRH